MCTRTTMTRRTRTVRKHDSDDSSVTSYAHDTDLERRRRCIIRAAGRTQWTRTMFRLLLLATVRTSRMPCSYRDGEKSGRAVRIPLWACDAFSVRPDATALAYPRRTALFAAEAASPERGSGSGAERGSSTQQRLSRPERKAIERAKKQQQQQLQQPTGGAGHNNRKRKHNYRERAPILRQTSLMPGEGRYDLHSNALPALCAEASTPEDVMRAIKRAQNLHDVHDLHAIGRFLLEQTDETFAYGYRGSTLARLAVAALHLDCQPLARQCLDERAAKHASTMLPMESAAVVRGLLRIHNVTDALRVLDTELPLPTFQKEGDDSGADATGEEEEDPAPKKELIRHRALSLASIASRHFFEDEPNMAVVACQRLADMGTIIKQVGLTSDELGLPWTRLLKGASQCQSNLRKGIADSCYGNIPADLPCDPVALPCNMVYAVLRAMTALPTENSDRIYELLANALVRRVVFVTGAISMDTCPPADRGEAVFLGRSNVGKSSLVNMVTNRKSLAYTSKRPGKTQQFNYFAVNDKADLEREIRYGDDVGGEKDIDSFYIVDMPGFGYAQVPDAQRESWRNFAREYLSTRSTLRVVFHLIDSRHGPSVDDEEWMQQIGELLPSYAKYVVVLTKADKNVKGAVANRKGSTGGGKVSTDIVKTLRRTMQNNGVGKAPIILTSAETKLGRDDVWTYLRLAAEV